jgi:hypothetical protein
VSCGLFTTSTLRLGHRRRRQKAHTPPYAWPNLSPAHHTLVRAASKPRVQHLQQPDTLHRRTFASCIGRTSWLTACRTRRTTQLLPERNFQETFWVQRFAHLPAVAAAVAGRCCCCCLANRTARSRNTFTKTEAGWAPVNCRSGSSGRCRSLRCAICPSTKRQAHKPLRSLHEMTKCGAPVAIGYRLLRAPSLASVDSASSGSHRVSNRWHITHGMASVSSWFKEKSSSTRRTHRTGELPEDCKKRTTSSLLLL